MTPTEIVVAITAIIGAGASILARQDVKRSMSQGWGEMTATLKGQGERLARVEVTVEEHTSDIGEMKGYLRGKANGTATGKF